MLISGLLALRLRCLDLASEVSLYWQAGGSLDKVNGRYVQQIFILGLLSPDSSLGYSQFPFHCRSHALFSSDEWPNKRIVYRDGGGGFRGVAEHRPNMRNRSSDLRYGAYIAYRSSMVG